MKKETIHASCRTRETPAAPSQARQLAAYIQQLKYESLPPEVVRRVKLLMTDSLGCLIAGGSTEPSQIVLDIFRNMGGAAEATVPAANCRLPVLHAVYLNSALANALDFEDNLPLCTVGHPSPTVFPPALAYAEHRHADGRQLICALVAGYETMLRIGRAVEPTFSRTQQVSGYATQQIFGAFAAVGKLLGLSREQLAWGYGVAGLTAPVPGVRKEGLDYRERPAGWVKNNYGWSAMGGALSAEMAARGFVGCPYIFDGPSGFWVMASSDRCREEWFTKDLGRRYQLMDIGFKPYACCRWLHSAIEAAEKITARRCFTFYDIARVTVRTFQEPYYNLREPHPTNLLDAQFSLPHVVALTLLGRSPARGLRRENLRDRQVLRLAREIEVVLDEEACACYQNPLFSEQHAVVEVLLNNGEILREKVCVAKGDSTIPLTGEELLRKYRDLAGPVVGRDRAERMLQRIWHMEEIEDLSEFFD